MRYIREDRARKASTVEDYRSILRVHLLPAFGEMAVESVSVADVEAFQAELGRREHRGRPITPRTKNKILNVLSGVFTRARKVWGLPDNPVMSVERHPQRVSGDIEVYAPEEVWALVRTAEDERDAAIFLTAAFTGLRMGEPFRSRHRAGRASDVARPEVGRPLPRAADAWVSEGKWFGWVLHDDGHGPDWRRAVGVEDLEGLWPLIVVELVSALVTEVRDLGALGVSCRVPLTLPVGGRLVSVRTAWHYAADDAAPRLVTAFPET